MLIPEKPAAREVAMNITVREVKSRRDKRTFLTLPEKIHAGHETWVHPIYMDDRAYFNPKKNRAFSYCDTIQLLAFEGDEPRGRAMGIVNRRYNEERKEKTARFGYLETYEDPRLVEALLQHKVRGVLIECQRVGAPRRDACLQLGMLGCAVERTAEQDLGTQAHNLVIVNDIQR